LIDYGQISRSNETHFWTHVHLHALQCPKPGKRGKETHYLQKVRRGLVAVEEERKGYEGVNAMPKKKSSSPKPSNAKNPYLELIRPLNALMSMIGVYIGYILSQGHFVFTTSIGYALVSVFCIAGAGQAINDYFDADIDKKQKSHRPIPSGRITKRHALVFSILLFALGIVLASFLDPLTFAIATFFSALLFLYSATMKHVKFFGNVMVALSVAFTFVFGASVNQVTPLVVLVSLSPFFSNWVREIMKDVEDEAQDQGTKLTLPHILKQNQVNAMVVVLLFFTLLAGYLPALLGEAGMGYTLLVSVANVVFILAGKELLNNHPTPAASLMKKGMMIGLVALLSLLL
jgi:geranylgeranylglycerol-phosphate geranylgeranyltransferase